jgi:hypothetical protein
VDVAIPTGRDRPKCELFSTFGSSPVKEMTRRPPPKVKQTLFEHFFEHGVYTQNVTGQQPQSAAKTASIGIRVI